MKKGLSIVCLMLLAGCSSPEVKGPIYLDCTLNGKAGDFGARIDELAGDVTHTRPLKDGGEYSFIAPAKFSASKISYESTPMPGILRVQWKYEIDRKSLSVKETFTAAPSDPRFADDKSLQKTTVLSGQCKIVKETESQI